MWNFMLYLIYTVIKIKELAFIYLFIFASKWITFWWCHEKQRKKEKHLQIREEKKPIRKKKITHMQESKTIAMQRFLMFQNHLYNKLKKLLSFGSNEYIYIYMYLNKQKHVHKGLQTCIPTINSMYEER